jgi:hypothetical protein
MVGLNAERVVPDRVNVDIEGLRQEVNEAYADNQLWDKLSLSQKLRTLIEERLKQIKEERAKP